MADSVDIAYLAEGDMKWMFGQTLRKVLRKIKDSQGRPIWTPGYESGITTGTPDLLLGYPIVINNDMPVPAANAKSLAFGQLQKYLIRDTMEVTMFRFDDSGLHEARSSRLLGLGALGWPAHRRERREVVRPQRHLIFSGASRRKPAFAARRESRGIFSKEP
jgi:hypothetical protein